MKTFVALLTALSVALSAVLVVLLVKGINTPLEPAVVAVEQAKPGPVVATSPAIDPKTWTSLQSPELPELADRLRAAGFPTEIVRAVISAQIAERMSARRKELDPEAETRPFWKTPLQDAKMMAVSRELSREHARLLREALGDDAESDFSYARMQQQLGFLPSEKAGEVRSAMRLIDERASTLLFETMSPAVQQEKLFALEQERNAAVRALLTPAEYTEYQLRTSRTSTMLRGELVGFNPTEQEFRTLFEVRLPLEDQGLPSVAPPSPETMRQRTEALQKANAAFKATLSPDRAAQFDRAQDYEYRRTSQLISRLELPAETTDRLYEVRKNFEPRVAALRSDRQMSMAQRNEALAALQQEAIATISPLVGDRFVDSYKQYGGNWLSSMVPRTPPPTSPNVERRMAPNP